jgi:hypothetical protein
MARLLLKIPDEYLPGIEAARHIENASGSSYETIEDYATHIAIEAAKSWCKQYQVGPYWVQPTPQFNSDGTPYETPTDTNGGNV